MIEVVVADTSAEARSKLAERIGEFQKEACAAHTVCPQIHLKPLSLQELRFASSPDIIVIGRNCLRQDLTEIASIRKLFPNARLIADLSAEMDGFIVTEQMARLGIDDILQDNTGALEFFRKLILLNRKNKAKKSGTLIVVDSGKGGMGVTSIAAGVAEACMSAGKKVIAVDLDCETQDLSRFLQVKPFINENLDAILNQERPVIEETVAQCTYQVWDEEKFFFVPPPQRLLEGSDTRPSMLRVMLSFFEALDHSADVVVVDMGGMRGMLRQAILRIADKVFFVVQNDPAALHATIHSLKFVVSSIAFPGDIMLVLNGSTTQGLSANFMHDEITRALRLNSDALSMKAVGWNRKGSRWPASGGTLFSQGSYQAKEDFLQILDLSGILPRNEHGSRIQIGVFSALKDLLAWHCKSCSRKMPEAKVTQPQVETKEDFLLLPIPEMYVTAAAIIEMSEDTGLINHAKVA